MKATGFWASLAGMVMLSSACERSPVASSEAAPGWLRATVTGGVQTEFSGRGYFTTDPDYRFGLPAKFQLDADGMGASEGQAVFGVWFGGAIPPVGQYELVRYRGVPEGFSLGFTYSTRERREDYQVTDGVIEITGSSPERVDGHFAATAWLYCLSPTIGPLTDENYWCVTDPARSPVPRVKSIQITGSFSLVPSEGKSSLD